MAFPAGAEGAHQLVNTSGAALRYLCFSTVADLEVAVYPDSGKIGTFGNIMPGSPEKEGAFAKYLRAGDEVGYYDGEG